MKAINTKDSQDTIAPRKMGNVSLRDGRLQAELKPGSWNVIVTDSAG
jgi:alpha-L-arabinofuranosidase